MNLAINNPPIKSLIVKLSPLPTPLTKRRFLFQKITLIQEFVCRVLSAIIFFVQHATMTTQLGSTSLRDPQSTRCAFKTWVAATEGCDSRRRESGRRIPAHYFACWWSTYKEISELIHFIRNSPFFGRQGSRRQAVFYFSGWVGVIRSSRTPRRIG